MNEDGTATGTDAPASYDIPGMRPARDVASAGSAPASRVRQYIVENFLYARPDLPFADDDALFGQGIIDSFGATELIAFLEDEFAIVIADDEVTEAHLGSVNAIAQFVASKRSSAGTSES